MLVSPCFFSREIFSFTSSKLCLRSIFFKNFIFTILAVSVALAVFLIFMVKQPVNSALRSSFFSVTSVLTTTGFFVSDYTLWPVGLWVVLLVLMFIGACSGSTAGGVKIIRHLIFIKNSGLELKRIIHPSAVIPVKINRKSISRSIILKTMTFVFLYFFIFVIGIIILLSMGIDFNTSVGASIASLSNLGTGIGQVGPFGTYAFLPQAAKWVLMAFMLLGRVEIFTLISIFSRNFWK